MDNFLETYSPPKLNQEETDDLNRPVPRSESESVIIILFFKLLTKVQTRWFHRPILPNKQKRTYTNFSQTFP